MNKISSHSLLKGGLTALLICAMSVVDQAKMSVNKTLSRTPPKIETPKNKEVVPYIEEMETQYETYCMIENASMLYDSLLSNDGLSELTLQYNRKEYQDSLYNTHPEAKKFDTTIKTGTYLREAQKNYLASKELLTTLFPKGWGFSWYQRFNRELTKYGWQTGGVEKNTFIFVNSTYLTFLIGFIEKNQDFKPILTTWSKTKNKNIPIIPPTGQFATVRDTSREQTIKVGSHEIKSKHYPAHEVFDAITKLGHRIYSSKDGEITAETTDCFDGGCTALTGVQLDIVIPGLEGLRNKIREELEKNSPGKYTIKDINFILRGLTESGHSFSINKHTNTYSGYIGGQLDPSWNNRIKIGKESSMLSQTVQSLKQVYCQHGGGTTFDISILMEQFRVIEKLVKQNKKIQIGNILYTMIDLGNGITALLHLHGKSGVNPEDDISYHLHGGFIPTEYLNL